MCDVFIIETESVDSIEVYFGKCSSCNKEVGISCSDIKHIEYCPMWGSKAYLKYI